MVKVIISHEVKNFSDWKKVFDSDESNRVQKGVKITGVYTAVDNANHVTVTSEFPSAEAVKGFMQNSDLKSTMEKAGVVSMPDVRVLNKVQ